jgi:hypothetical protein
MSVENSIGFKRYLTEIGLIALTITVANPIDFVRFRLQTMPELL